MKNKDLKKSKESTIGKIIYGFLLFMPLLAILITCGYAMFNKNAYQSYYATTLNEETYINNNLSNIDNNQIYYLNTQNYENNTVNAFELYTNDFEVVNNGNLASTQVERFNSYSEIRIYCRNNNTPEFYGINNDNTYTWITNNSLFVCKFKINNKSGTINNPLGFYTIEYDNMSYISEVFYYSVNKAEESELFNWSKNSIIYTGIHNTCTQLSITNTFIPMLLAYWLIISVIYILYDIILMILIILHNRVHRLQDSLS